MRAFLKRLFRKRYPEELWLPVWFLKIVEIVWPVNYFAFGVEHDMQGFRRNAKLYVDRAGYLWTVALLTTLLAYHFGTPTEFRIGLGFVIATTGLFAATAAKAIRAMRAPPGGGETSL